MKRVRPNELDYADDGLYYDGDVPFTGVIYYTRDPGGWLEAEEEYRDGLAWGRRQAWFRSGGPREEASCAWGVYHGRVRKWHENGHLASDATYAYGIRVEEMRWDETGKLLEDYHIPEEEKPRIEMYRRSFEDEGGPQGGG